MFFVPTVERPSFPTSFRPKGESACPTVAVCLSQTKTGFPQAFTAHPQLISLPPRPPRHIPTTAGREISFLGFIQRDQPRGTRTSEPRAGHSTREACQASWSACEKQQRRTGRRGSRRCFTTSRLRDCPYLVAVLCNPRTEAASRAQLQALLGTLAARQTLRSGATGGGLRESVCRWCALVSEREVDPRTGAGSNSDRETTESSEGVHRA